MEEVDFRWEESFEITQLILQHTLGSIKTSQHLKFEKELGSIKKTYQNTRKMVQVKPNNTEVVQPRPKYGHLSEIHPDFAPLKEAADREFALLWELPLEDFKKDWISSPPVLFDDSPIVGRDITIEHMKVLVRDGTQIEIRIYKPINPTPNSLLDFNCHGGGM